MNIIEQFEKDQIKSLVKGKKIPQFHPGDTVRVNVKVREGTRERIQAFEGVCIRKKNRGLSSSFTVRKISFGEGVERVFPIFSPSIDSISIVRSGQVRRAKLYYLRDLTGKKARIVERIRKKQPDLASLYIDESEEVVEEVEDQEVSVHPYDLPGEWFVLNAQSGHEKKVQTNILTRIKNLHLEEKVYEVIIPTDEVVEIRNGKKVNIEKKTFPGYVLVRMDLDDTTWYEIRNTPSVIGFVGSGKVPIPLSKREVERILGTNEEIEVKKESPKCKPDFEVGETVRVTTGPFADFNGIIEEINLDQSKVTVLVNIFGRETPVELGFTDIVKN